MGYVFHFGMIGPYLKVLLSAGLFTLELGAICIIAATILGLIIGALHTARNATIRAVCRSYVETFRLTPFLVQMLWVYFGFPMVLGIMITPAIAGVVTLSLNGAAYASEIFRAGIQSVPRTQIFASLSLGMTIPQTMGRIVIPQGVRIVLPSYVNLIIEILKDTSMFSIIGVSEITGLTKLIVSETFRAFELYTFLAVFYLCFTLCLGRIGRLLETRVFHADKI